MLSIFEDRLANSEKLFRLLPRGILMIVVMLFVGTAGTLVLRLVQHSEQGVRRPRRVRRLGAGWRARCRIL